MPIHTDVTFWQKVCFLLPAIPVTFMLSVGAHELGHLLYALAHGFKFYLLIVGPFGVKVQDSKKVCYIEKNISFWGGFSGALPQNTDESNIKVFANMLKAGPITSLVIAIISFSMCWFLRAFYFPMFFFLLLGSELLGTFAATAFAGGSAWLMPDMARYRLLKRADERAKREVTLIELSFSDALNTLDGDAEARRRVEFLRASDEPRYSFFGAYYAYKLCGEADAADRNAALQDLRRAAEHFPPKIAKAYIDDLIQ